MPTRQIVSAVTGAHSTTDPMQASDPMHAVVPERWNPCRRAPVAGRAHGGASLQARSHRMEGRPPVSVLPPQMAGS